MISSKSPGLLQPLAVAALAVAGMTCGVAHAAPDAQRVARDPQTGALRAPTADESAALERAARDSRKADGLAHRRGMVTGTLEPKVKKRADGSSVYELPEEYMTHVVVTRMPDGTLQEQCLPDATSAQRAVSGKKTSFARNLSERSHETK